jgi:recombination protein RecT
MTATSVSNAVAKRDNGPESMIARYKGDFATVLPSHIKPETWVRVAQGLLRRNDKLATAATNNPGSFLAALLECARLGLEPGDTFHLVPIGGDIVGITDYTGEIELIYRAQAVSSIKAEVVYSNDTFIYSPDMERPRHEVDWFGERGDMIGAYAYGVMKDGATSRVVVMSKKEIDAVKAVNRLNASNRPDNPWVKWTDRMWLKTVVKQLAKWVPSSPEYLEHALRAQAAGEVAAAALPVAVPQPPPVDVTHLVEAEPVVDAELVEPDPRDES